MAQIQTQPGSLRERLQRQAQEISERYGREGFRCPSELVTSFSVLRLLLEFFDYYNSKQYTLGMKLLIDSRLVPLQASELDESIKNFRRYNTEVWNVFPDVLLAVMNILFEQYQKVKGNEFIPPRYQDSAVDKVIIIRNYRTVDFILSIYFSNWSTFAVKQKSLPILQA